MKKRLRNFDFTLLFTPLLLTAFGSVMIYSASYTVAVVKFDWSATHFFVRTLVWFALAIPVFAFFSFVPYQKYHKVIKPLMLVIFLMLVLVLFTGKVNGSRSWFSLGFFSVQPAELAKVGMIIYLASIYSKKQSYLSSFSKGVLPPLIALGIILGLIVIQPDVGNASIIFLISCSIIFSAGIKIRHLSLLIVAGLLLILAVWPHMVTDERVSRFTGAYQPFDEEHVQDDGFQLVQSYLAIGTGGVFGVGLGQGVQKLGYLPEPHTDFIMAVIAEELGFLGVAAVLAMLAIIVLRGLYIAKQCRDSFGSLLAIGISSMVGIQTFINLGAITGLLPITGVTLPFVSYGGTSLLILFASMGILNNVAKYVRSQELIVSDSTFTQDKRGKRPSNRQRIRTTSTTTQTRGKTRGGERWTN
ncbi:cell division-specific peptidoglycan biosynthesis regulator FtsW [Terribacillus aidingensis]|uniref:Probable peptidoglycan glycosyltransferase FtsW n=1 Tax=Terribacillus aidingensis TaxID=586416 RepID=A0A285NIH9_9BACI|nr:putative lipid II flippase FtsW [Terribacillus aidingensis]SNZ09290.1 cell division-specific peptidoglycan biosynthesis regulator FtsW [Terribacillus aidingensis]